jgi:hypothetical protein
MAANRDNSLNEKLTKLISKYQTKGKPDLLWNVIFRLMFPELLKIIKGILGKRGRYEAEEELISPSWDAFLFCLEQYNPNYPPLPISAGM